MNSKLIVAVIAALGVTAAFAHGGMEKADTDGDGYVTLDELKAAHSARIEEHFVNVDANADGLLSEEEIKAAHKARHERHKAEGKHRHHGKMNPEKMVERLDTDGSGSVSLAEFDGRRFSPDAEAFEAADSDGSGELDAAELHAMMKAHRAERRDSDRIRGN